MILFGPCNFTVDGAGFNLYQRKLHRKKAPTITESVVELTKASSN
jgi:hypothetical protein